MDSRGRGARRGALGLAAASVVGLAARPSPAACPGADPGEAACEPIVSFLMPSAAGAAFFPRNAGGPYFGGGVEFGLVSWSNNNDAFGPSQGRLRVGVAYVAGVDGRQQALYHLGGVVSFEGNAGRRFLIPYYSAAIGGIYDTVLGNHAAADASLGLYIVYLRRFVLDAEGGCVLPVTDIDKLLGARTQLTASFSLW